jgi:hypothetical protein
MEGQGPGGEAQGAADPKKNKKKTCSFFRFLWRSILNTLIQLTIISYLGNRYNRRRFLNQFQNRNFASSKLQV